MLMAQQLSFRLLRAKSLQDVQLMYVDITQQQLLLPVPHVVIAVVIAAVATVMIVTLLTHQALAVAEPVMEAVAVVPAAKAAKPRWSKSPSSVSYTTAQVQSLTPIRQAVEKLAIEQPDLRDVFLCHAWDDRQGIAKELHDLLEAAGVKVWFSEKDLAWCSDDACH